MVYVSSMELLHILDVWKVVSRGDPPHYVELRRKNAIENLKVGNAGISHPFYFTYIIQNDENKHVSERLLELSGDPHTVIQDEAGVAHTMGNTYLKPWGTCKVLYNDDDLIVKETTIDPEYQTSWHYHKHRVEHIICHSGRGTIEIHNGPTLQAEPLVVAMTPGHSVTVEANHLHALHASRLKPLVIVEIWRGGVLEESDIVRVHDTYGRL